MNFYLCSKSEGINIIQRDDILVNLQTIFTFHCQHFLSLRGANAKDNASLPPAECLKYREYKEKPQKSEWNQVFILSLHILAKANNHYCSTVLQQGWRCVMCCRHNETIVIKVLGRFFTVGSFGTLRYSHPLIFLR